MKRYITIILAIAAPVLLMGNVMLFMQGKSYYTQLCSVRLDPVQHCRISSQCTNGVDIVLLGDSRAADWTIPKSYGCIINHGLYNQTSAQVLARLGDTLALKPKAVIIQVGMNDLKAIPVMPDNKNRIISDLENNIREMVARIKGNGSHVIITTIFPPASVPLTRKPFWNEKDVNHAIRLVNCYIKSLENDGVTVIDTHSILRGQGESICPIYSRDFLHVNERGYLAINKKIAREIVGG